MAFLEYNPRDTLYHYCSKDAFRGVISTKELWFSNLRSANDPRELTYGYDNVFRILRATSSRTESAEIRRIVDYLDKNLTIFYNSVNVYCACFTHIGDSLPMWGAYGGAYTGLSIGFRPTAITDIPARIQKVRYLAQGDDRELSEFLIDIISSFRGWEKELEAIKLVASTLSAIVALKHNTWSYEQEVRMTYVQVRNRPSKPAPNLESAVSIGVDDKTIYWREPHTRTLGENTIEYLNFPYGKYLLKNHDARMAIKEIIDGPKCDLSDQEISDTLTKNGFRNFIIKRSVCDIR